MEDQSSQERSHPGESGSGILVALSLVALIVAMVASVYYPYPSGKPLGVVDFLLLWLREALIVAAALAVVVVLALAAVMNALRRLLQRARNKQR